MLILRAHHLFCIQGYTGKGYSRNFVKSMDKVVNSLTPTALVKITEGADDICRECPHLLKDHLCNRENKVSLLDTSALETLKIKANSIYEYKKLLEALKNNATLKHFRETCATCSWFSYGYCERGIFKGGSPN